MGRIASFIIIQNLLFNKPNKPTNTMTCYLKSSGEMHHYTQDRNLQRHIIYHVTGFDTPFTARQFNKLFKLNK